MPSARSATSSTRERLRELENLLVAQEAAEQRVANAIPRKPLKALYTRMKQIDRKRWVQPVSAPPALPHRSHNTIAIPHEWQHLHDTRAHVPEDAEGARRRVVER